MFQIIIDPKINDQMPKEGKREFLPSLGFDAVLMALVVARVSISFIQASA